MKREDFLLETKITTMLGRGGSTGAHPEAFLKQAQSGRRARMKDKELQFDRTCHVLYSKPCKKEIRAKIALHYPEAEREAVWE